MATLDTTRSPIDSLRSRSPVRRHPRRPGWDDARRLSTCRPTSARRRSPSRPTSARSPPSSRTRASAACASRRSAPATTPGPLGSLEDADPLRPRRMTGVPIDAEARRARVARGDALGGRRRRSVRARAGARCTAPRRDVGVVGYSLGGGIGWLARKHGMQTNSVTAIELVTADGAARPRGRRARARAVLGPARRRRQLRRRHRDRVRRSCRSRELYAGALFFPFERTAEVLHAWTRAAARRCPTRSPRWATSCSSRRCRRSPRPCAASRSWSSRRRSWAPRPTGGSCCAAARARPGAGHVRDAAAGRPGRPGDGPARPVPYISAHVLVDDLPAAGDRRPARIAGPGRARRSCSCSCATWAARWPAAGRTGAARRCRHVRDVRRRHRRSTPSGRRPSRPSSPPCPPRWRLRGRPLPELRRGAGGTERLLRRRDLGRLRAVKALYDPEDLFRANHPVS